MAPITNTPTKPYDGNTTATLTSSNFSLSGLYSPDSFAVTQTAGTYDHPNVADATTVSTTLASGDFTANGNTLASDYTLPTTASGPGAITKVNATIQVTPYNVPFDGNPHTATGTATGVGGVGLSGLESAAPPTPSKASTPTPGRSPTSPATTTTPAARSSTPSAPPWSWPPTLTHR